MTMHDNWTDQLSDYLDGELTPEEQAERAQVSARGTSDRPIEQFERLLVAGSRPRVDGGVRAQITIVGIEAVGRLALGALDLRLLEFRRDRADHALGHLVLERAVETVGPEMPRRV